MPIHAPRFLRAKCPATARLDQSKKHRKIRLRPINFSPCFQTCDSCRGYLFFRSIGVFCENGTFVPECDFGCPSGGDFVTDQEASCLFEKMPGGKVSTNQVHEV